MPHPSPRPLRVADQKRIDQACVAFESAWTGGERPRVEDFIPPDAPDGVRTALLRELVLLDAHYRARAGESPSAADYQGRFPEFDTAWLDDTGPAAPVYGAAPLPATAPSGYEILGELGRGGMGVVYKARQKSLGRVVALKMIRSAAQATPLEQARFQLEVDCAARVQHPNVVTVFGAGTHQGQPFVVLEYVEGGTLRDRKPAGAAEAARLAATLAEAVQALHAQGIVHRDLKPTNVLIAADGTPKVTDFGLAKPAGEDVTGLTATGQVVGTPAYMAPEQASGERNVGPAADVYSLGAILYELLTGRPPFTAPTVLQLLEQVRSDEPPAPRSLNAAVPRDLETICLKCLHKLPARRYPTAGELAADLRRFGAGEPIRARPVPVWERGALWARRKPALATLAGLLLLVFTGSVPLLSWLYLREERRGQELQASLERTRKSEAVAKAVNDFLVKDIVEAAQPAGRGLGREVTLQQALDTAAPKVAARFADLPEAELIVRRMLRDTYTSLGAHTKALPQADRCVELSRVLNGPDAPDTFRLRADVAAEMVRVGRGKEAEAHFEATLADARRALGPDHEETAFVEMSFVPYLAGQQRLAEAEALVRHVHQVHRHVYGPADIKTVMVLHNLAAVLAKQGKFDEAEPPQRELLDVFRAKVGPKQLETLVVQGMLADILKQRGKLDESEELARRTLADRIEVLGETHPHTLANLELLASLALARDRPRDAEPLSRKVLAVRQKDPGPNAPDTVYSLRNLVEALAAQRKLEEADALSRQAVEAAAAAFPPSSPDLAAVRYWRAAVLRLQGKPADAVPLLRQALAAEEKALPASDPAAARSRLLLGACLGDLSQHAEAEPLLVRGYRVLAASPRTPPHAKAAALRDVIGFYEKWGKKDKAEQWRAKEGSRP